MKVVGGEWVAKVREEKTYSQWMLDALYIANFILCFRQSQYFSSLL